MTEYEFLIAFKEGKQAHRDGVLCMDNPYDGVSASLEMAWDDGWWDVFYEDVK
jgi:hypothetical protein